MQAWLRLRMLDLQASHAGSLGGIEQERMCVRTYVHIYIYIYMYVMSVCAFVEVRSLFASSMHPYVCSFYTHIPCLMLSVVVSSAIPTRNCLGIFFWKLSLQPLLEP